MEMTSEIMLAVLPLLAIEIFLKILCLRDWLKRERFQGLSKWPWLLIFLFVTMFGPIAYLVYGRKTDGR